MRKKIKNRVESVTVMYNIPESQNIIIKIQKSRKIMRNTNVRSSNWVVGHRSYKMLRLVNQFNLNLET
jgi:hypothetical protein